MVIEEILSNLPGKEENIENAFNNCRENLYQKLRNINTKFSDFTGFDVTYTLRKISQYDVRKWKDITEKDADSIYSLAKELISFIEKRCYQ